MNPVTLIFILGLLAAVWWLLRLRRKAAAEDATAAARPSPAKSQFHAVSITYPGPACDAAKNMNGRRFLATAAPRLPLPKCDVLDCKCRFTHHKDRRAGRDRRSPFGPGGIGGGTGAFDREQREGSDRRKPAH